MLTLIVATLGLVSLSSGQRQCNAVCDPCTLWGGGAGWCFEHWGDGFECSRQGGTKCDDPARSKAARFYASLRRSQEFYEVSRQSSYPTCECPDFQYSAMKGDVMCQFGSGCRMKLNSQVSCPGGATTCTLDETCPTVCNEGNYEAGAKNNEIMCAYQNHCTRLRMGNTRCEDNGKKCFLTAPAALENNCIGCGFKGTPAERHACYNTCGGRSIESVVVPKYMVKLAGLVLAVMFVSCAGFSYFRYSKKQFTVENVSARDSEYDSIIM